jgi:Tol biopolymer transport system component
MPRLSAIAAIAAALIVAACASPASSAPGAAATAAPSSVATDSPSLASSTLAPTPPPLGDRPWVAFQAMGPCGYGVQLEALDGGLSRVGAVDCLGGWQEHPDWSPDGRRFVFTIKHDDDSGDLWIADADTGAAERLIACEAPCVWVDEPAWSPGGKSIAFQRLTRDGNIARSTIEIIDLATQGTRVVATLDEGIIGFAPRWAPDQRTLVMEAIRAPGPEDPLPTSGTVALIEVTNPVLHELVPWDDRANNPDWSPDGQWIVFSAPDEGGEPGGGRSDLWLIGPNGDGLRRLTSVAADGGFAIQPTFTPDGTRVVFVYAEREGADQAMATIALDGSDLQPAIKGQWVDGFHPRIRP